MGASQVAQAVKNPPANAGEVRDSCSMPGLGKSPRGEHGNPRQHSCLENPVDGGAWRAGSRRVTESDMTEETAAHRQQGMTDFPTSDG